jgi:hypothetical protein
MSVLPTHPLQPAKMKLHQPTCMSHSSCTCHGQKWWRTKEAIGILGIQEVSQHAPKRPSFFFWWRGDGFFGFLLLPICSHQVTQVPNWVSQHIPSVFSNNTSLYSITFALSSTLVTYKQTKKRIQTVQSLIYFFDGPLNDAHHKRKKNNFGGPHY